MHNVCVCVCVVCDVCGVMWCVCMVCVCGVCVCVVCACARVRACQYQITIQRPCLGEGYAMWHCTLQLDLTFGSGFSTGVYSCLADVTCITALQLNGKQEKKEILLTSCA